MNYSFPIIKHINDVLPAIENRKEFIIAERDDYDVVNYIITMPDTFDIIDETIDNHGVQIPVGIMRRECRGLIFNKDGTIMSRPVDKFFNVGEREETQIHNIDFSKKHSIFIKEDGSMMRPLLIDGNIRWGTKMGLTDIALDAEVFVAKNRHYEHFAAKLMKNNITPIFEYVGPKNRIVLHYEATNMILLAMRDNFTGEYIEHKDVAAEYNIPVVDEIQKFETLDALVAFTRPRTVGEGFIVAFDDGMRVKIKNDWYVRIHKVKSQIQFDRNILALILNNDLDDIIPDLDEADLKHVKEVEDIFWAAFTTKLAKLDKASELAIKKADGDRKILATEVLPESGLNKTEYRFVFGNADGKRIYDMLLEHVHAAVNNNTKYDAMMRWITTA